MESTSQKESSQSVSNSNDDQQSLADPLVQYIAIRSDLKWPKGALIAQCCHASIAAIHLNYTETDTSEYLRNLDQMHKVVVGVPSLAEINEYIKFLGGGNDDEIEEEKSKIDM